MPFGCRTVRVVPSFCVVSFLLQKYEVFWLQPSAAAGWNCSCWWGMPRMATYCVHLAPTEGVRRYGRSAGRWQPSKLVSCFSVTNSNVFATLRFSCKRFFFLHTWNACSPQACRWLPACLLVVLVSCCDLCCLVPVCSWRSTRRRGCTWRGFLCTLCTAWSSASRSWRWAGGTEQWVTPSWTRTRPAPTPSSPSIWKSAP